MSEPNSLEAERTVIGGLLVDGSPDAVSLVQGILTERDWFHARARACWLACVALAGRGERIDLVTLRDELRARKEAKLAADTAWLAGLVDGVPRITNLEDWAGIVRRTSQQRQLMQLAARLQLEAGEEGADPAQLADRAMSALLTVGELEAGAGWCDNGDLARRAVREIEEQAATSDGVLGLRTGLIDLDQRLQGIRAGTMGLIGARLGQGKSVLALQIAEAVAAENLGRVAVFSLEMSGTALMKRRLSGRALVSINRLHRADPDANAERWNRIGKAFAYCAQPDLMINTAATTVPQIRAASRFAQAKHGLALVIVDYAQLLSGTSRHEKRHMEIKEISGGLKRMALDLGVAVIVVSQLNRESEARNDHRPTMADIADGDSLGRDADWAILIQRDLKAAKGQDAAELRNLSDLWLAKHREGASGRVRVRWNPVLARFESLGGWSEEASA